jgi:hypothetical protein
MIAIAMISGMLVCACSSYCFAVPTQVHDASSSGVLTPHIFILQGDELACTQKRAAKEARY